MNTSKPETASTRLRRLGWLTVLAFSAKGLVTGSLIVWAVLSAL